MIRASVAPTIAFGLTGACVSVVLPAVLAGAVQAQRIAADEANLIISAEMFGAALATAAVSPFLARVNRKAIALLAAAVALCANVVAAQALSYEWLAPIRFGAGVAEGTVLALAVAFIAGTKLPDRNVGLFVASHLSASTVILRLSPVATDALGSHGAFWILAGLATVSLVAILALPTNESSERGAGAAAAPSLVGMERSVRAVAIVVGLAGNVVFFTGTGSIWPLMLGLANGIGLPLSATSQVLGNATLAGIGGALLAAWSGALLGRRAALAIGSGVMLSSLIALGNAADLAGFALGAITFMASWIFLVPSYVGILALADPKGRAAAFAMATQYVGLALGPLLAAVLHRNGDYSPVLIAGGCLAAIAAAAMVYADSRTATRQISLHEA